MMAEIIKNITQNCKKQEVGQKYKQGPIKLPQISCVWDSVCSIQ